MLYPLHPRIVHFPIALTLVGAAFIMAGMFGRREIWTAYGRLSLLLGWIAAIMAALSGLVDQNKAPEGPAVAAVLNQHITAGVALIIVSGLALYWPLRDRQVVAHPTRRWGYAALLLVGMLLVILSGWLGGKLVYTLGVGMP